MRQPIILLVCGSPDRAEALCQFASIHLPEAHITIASTLEGLGSHPVSRKPDLVLVYPQGPAQTGMEQIRRLRELPEGARVPAVLLMPNEGDAALLAEAHDAGAEAICLGDCPGTALAAVLRLALRAGALEAEVSALGGRMATAPSETMVVPPACEASRGASVGALAEEQARQRNVTLAALFDSAPYAMVALDGEARLHDANEAAVLLAGRPREELLGLTCGELLSCTGAQSGGGCGHHARCADCPIRAMVAHTLRSRKPTFGREGDLRVIHEGKERTMVALLSTGPLGGMDEDLVLLTITDVTEQRRHEGALRESEERFRALFETMRQGVFYQRADGVITDANPAALGMLGLTREEFLGRTSEHAGWDVVAEDGTAMPPEEHPSIVTLRTGKPSQDRVVGVADGRTGERRWLVVNAMPRFHAGDVLPYQVAVTLHDTTDRKLAEAALARSEERFRAFMDNNPTVAWAKDADGRYVYVNAAHSRVSGFHPSECYGRTDAELWPKEIAERFLAHDQQVLESGQPMEAIEEALTVKGEPYHGWAVKFPFSDGEGRTLIGGIAVDMTARKLAEDALRTNELRHRRLLENTPSGYFRVGLDRRFEDVNPAWLALHGYSSADEVVGQPFTLTQPPEDVEAARAIVDGILGGTPIPRGEFRRLRKDGRIGHHTFSAHPILEQGRVVGLEGFLIDTTAEIQAQADYRVLFESMIDGLAVHQILCDEDGEPCDYRFLAVNPAFERMTGLRAEDVVGKTVLEVMPNTERHWIGSYGHVALTGEPRHFDSYSKALDRHYEVTAYRSGEGQFAVVCIDITDRVRSAQALRDSEEKYAKAFAASPDAVALMAASDGRFLDVNEGFALLTGHSREEAVGRTDLELGVWWHLDERQETYARLLRDNRLRECRVLGRAKDGSQIPFSISAERVEIGGKPCILGFARDLAGEQQAEAVRAKLEEQLRQAAKMEAVGQLAGGVAHDFNNLLTPILGYGTMLAQRLQDRGPDQRYATEIIALAERAAALTRQLLAFSRKQVLHFISVDPNQVLQGLSRMLSRLISENVQLVWELGEGLGTVRADPGQLEQVIVNLAVNARDAMPEGGTLTFRTSQVTLTASEASDLGLKATSFVRIEVADTGVGIAPDTQARIFEPFFTTKEMGRGTGLGLSTVYGIVGQSGGHIGVTSELGRGTTFRVLLPMAAGPSHVPETQEPAASGGRETLLVAEDDGSVRDLIESVLGSAGYTVLLAEDGRHALRLAQEHPGGIDLLVTDVVMPGLHGPGLAAELEASRPETKVLYMSGYVDSPLLDRKALDPGAPFLQKPFGPNQLLKRVRELLDS